MAGTYEGGIKAAQTNKLRRGENFYREIGRKGGLISKNGGFAANRELAREAGRKGGLTKKGNYQTRQIRVRVLSGCGEEAYQVNGVRYCDNCGIVEGVNHE